MVSCGTITIEQQFEAGNVEITNCSFPQTVTQGDTAEAQFTVTNGNSNAATVTYAVFIGSTQVASGTVQVSGGGNVTETASFSVSNSPGSHPTSVETTSIQGA